MGDWTMLHYGGPIDTGLDKSLCGMTMGGRHAATYRRYEIEQPEHVPENCQPCGTCKDALTIDVLKLRRAERLRLTGVIGSARSRIPDLVDAGRWSKIAKLAENAAQATEALKAIGKWQGKF